jgi:hypothetical protein
LKIEKISVHLGGKIQKKERENREMVKDKGDKKTRKRK